MPKDYPRQTRVADLVQKEVAQLLQREAADPRFQMVTLSTVRLSVDFSLATVYFTVLDEENHEKVEKALNQASGFLRGMLAKRSTLRRVPRLRFIYDEALIAGNRIARIISEVSVS